MHGTALGHTARAQDRSSLLAARPQDKAVSALARPHLLDKAPYLLSRRLQAPREIPPFPRARTRVCERVRKAR